MALTVAASLALAPVPNAATTSPRRVLVTMYCDPSRYPPHKAPGSAWEGFMYI